jgi:hypothetical protein
MKSFDSCSVLGELPSGKGFVGGEGLIFSVKDVSA